MRIAEINMMHIGSTGKIMLSIAQSAREAGAEAKTFSPRYYRRDWKEDFPEIPSHSYFGSRTENMLHLRLSQITGYHGCFSQLGTYRLLRELDRYKPDVIHLHNLHNWTINLPMLFGYIKKRDVKVIWTLHDCWSFTGQCPHFEIAKCDKWRTQCHCCPQIHEYPKSFVDNTGRMYRLKRSWFTGVENLTLATPSKWLAGLVKESYLKDYPVQVINNGIDLSVFSPDEGDFRKKHRIPKGIHIVLGVAFDWGYRKGLDVFQKLALSLGNEYQIVLVGTDEKTDAQLPNHVISIHRTNNQAELAQIYSASDVFVNPTREENFPTVNIEALACGTPVITFRTGGSPEIIDETCGSVVECDDVDALEKEIVRVCSDRPYSQEACVKRAQRYDQKDRFIEYVSLYEEVKDQ